MKLRGHIEERSQREVAVLELGVRNAESCRLERPALIPKQVEVDAARAPAFVRNSMTA